MIMEILTKLDSVFEATNICTGCGSLLGLKMVLQSVELKNTVLILSPGEVSQISKSRPRVSLIVSKNPAATALGLAKSRQDLNIIVHAGDGITASTLPSLLSTHENILYVCYNNSMPADSSYYEKDFTHAVPNASYSATASVAYYEDFVNKIKKALSKPGFKFINLLTPCPARWKFDTSNTIEIGRVMTETSLWPLYEIENGTVSVTKMPARIEPVKRFFEIMKTQHPEEKVQELQDRANRKSKQLNEGRIL